VQRAAAIRRFALPQAFGQGIRRPLLAHRHDAVQRVPGRQTHRRRKRGLVEPAHRMRDQTHRLRLQGKAHPGRSAVEPRRAVRHLLSLAVRDRVLRRNDEQGACLAGPDRVVPGQSIADRREGRFAPPRPDKAPRLVVRGRRCPAGSFQQRHHFIHRHRALGEGPRRPARRELRCDQMVGQAPDGQIKAHDGFPRDIRCDAT
jgi:hypothetical protein